MSPLTPIRISSIRCSYSMFLALTDTGEALHWGVLSAIFLTFVLFIYHVTTYSHQDLLHPVFVLHGPGPHRHRWGPPLGSAKCYISNVCFIHTSCHYLLPSGSPPSGVRTTWSWPSQTPMRPSTGSAQCYISNVCFIHTSCHYLLPSGSPPSGVRTTWSWPSQTPVRPSTGDTAVITPWSQDHGGWRGVPSPGKCSPRGIMLTLEAPYIWVRPSCMKRYYLYISRH